MTPWTPKVCTRMAQYSEKNAEKAIILPKGNYLTKRPLSYQKAIILLKGQYLTRRKLSYILLGLPVASISLLELRAQ